MSQNQNKKMYRRNRRDAIRHYRGFCDYINKKNLRYDKLLYFADRYYSDKTVLQLSDTDTEYNMTDLIVIAIEILTWLKLEYKRSLWRAEGRTIKQRPMHIDENYPWCALLINLLEAETIFSKVFTINGNALDFRSDINEEYRALLRKTAYDKYNPTKII